MGIRSSIDSSAKSRTIDAVVTLSSASGAIKVAMKHLTDEKGNITKRVSTRDRSLAQTRVMNAIEDLLRFVRTNGEALSLAHRRITQ